MNIPLRFERRIEGRVLVAAYGAGANSTAMLCLMIEKGIKTHRNTFADTGGERPETYDLVNRFSEYLVAHGMAPIDIVSYRSKKHGDTTLEQECLRTKSLPSKAYGWSKCSEKWKIRPQNAILRADPVCRGEWKAGHKVVKLIGFDAGEERRAKHPVDARFEWEYPLIEWQIYREDCDEICRRHGFTVPKSSCFFCPSMKKREIAVLQQEHPELLARALAMEELAQPGLITVKGLGRNYSWKDYLQNRSCPLFDSIKEPEQDCGCYDG